MMTESDLDLLEVMLYLGLEFSIGLLPLLLAL